MKEIEGKEGQMPKVQIVLGKDEISNKKKKKVLKENSKVGMLLFPWQSLPFFLN